MADSIQELVIPLIHRYSDSLSLQQILKLLNKAINTDEVLKLLNQARQSSTLSNIANDFARIVNSTKPFLNPTVSTQHELDTELDESITPFYITWFSFIQLIPHSKDMYTVLFNFHGIQISMVTSTDFEGVSNYIIKVNNEIHTGSFQTTELCYVIFNAERVKVTTDQIYIAKPRKLEADFLSQDLIDVLRSEEYVITAHIVKVSIPLELEYKSPSLTTTDILKTSIKVRDLSLNPQFYKTNGHDTCTFYYSQPEYEYLEDYELIPIGLEYLLVNVLTEAIQYQAALYLAQQQELISEANSQSTTELESNIVQLNRDVADISNILSKVLIFDEQRHELNNLPFTVCTAQAPIATLPEKYVTGNSRNMIATSNVPFYYPQNDKITFDAINPQTLSYQESNRVYEDDDLLILAEYNLTGQVDYSDKSPITEVSSKPMEFMPITEDFYDSRMLQRTQQATLNTGFYHQDQVSNSISIPLVDAEITLELKAITVLYKKAYSNVVGSSGSISLNLFNPVTQDRFPLTSSTLANITHQTDKYGQLHGITFPLSKSFTNKITDASRIIRLRGFKAIQQVNVTPTSYELNAATTVLSYNDSDISISGVFSVSAKVQELLFEQLRLTWWEWSGQHTVNISSYSLTRKLALPGTESYNDWNFRGLTMDQLRTTASANSATALSNFGALAHSLIVEITHLRLSAQVPLAPADLGFRTRYDETINQVASLAYSLLIRINNIERELKTITNRIDALEEQLTILWDATFAAKKNDLLMMFVDTIVSTVLPIGIGVAFKAIQLVMSKATTISRNISQLAATNSQHFRKTLGNKYSKQIEDTSAVRTAIHFNVAKESKNINTKDLETGKRPVFSRNDNKKDILFEQVDLSDAIDFNYTVRTKYSKINETYSPQNLTTKTISKSDLPTPTYSFNIEPLTFLGKLGGPTFSLTNSKLSKALVQSNIARHSTKLPVHASGSTTREFRKNGDLYRRLTVVGVAETPMARIPVSQSRGAIGGMIIDYKQVGVDSDGKNIFRYLTWQEHNHQPADVKRWYYRMYGDKTIQGKTEEDQTTWMWHQIVGKLENKAKQNRSLYSMYIPDTSRLEALENLVAKTSTFDYNLLSNNCQTFAKQLGNYLQSGTMMTCLPESTILSMYQSELAHVYKTVRSISDIPRAMLARFGKRALPIKVL